MESGANPIIVPGSYFRDIAVEVAQNHRETDFVVLDAIVREPDIYSILFKEHEGCFLAGILAAMATKSKTIGFIGGMDIPVIRSFYNGFVQGIHYIDPEIKVLHYLMFSHEFAQKHPVLAETIWNKLSAVRESVQLWELTEKYFE